MSYEIYKSVSQLADGRFKCVSSSNNVYPHHFGEWIMDYYSKEFPNANPAELKACWMLASSYHGDKFYQSNWKKEQKLATTFLSEKHYKWDFMQDKLKHFNYAKEFLEWKKAKAKVKMKKFIVSMVFSAISREYIGKKSSRRVWSVDDKEKAKVFKAYCKEDVEKLFSGYSKYEPLIEEVE